MTRKKIELFILVFLGSVMVLYFLEWGGLTLINWNSSAMAQSGSTGYSAISSVLTPDPEDIPFFRAIADDQEKKLSTCKSEDECRAVHFLRGVVALYENRELAALHFRKVVASNPNSVLAGESRFWLWLLDVLNAPGGGIASEGLTKRLVREIVNKELLVHELSRQLEADSVDALKQELTNREKAVDELNQALSNLSKQTEQLKKEQALRQDVQQELKSSEKKVQELTNQLEALRRIDQEIREKAPPTRPSEKMAPTPKLERAEEKELPHEGEGKNRGIAMADERILVVDDDPSLLTLLKMRLHSMGFVVTACGSGGDALSRVQEDPYDFAILDLRLPDADGLDLMEELHQHQTNLPILILTAHGCIPNAVEAMKKGAYGYLTKPFDDKELLESIDKALTTKRMSQEIHRLQLLVNELYGLENVVARSAEMHTVLKQVAQVAKTDTTVCISGETGTGKEVIARVLHCNSPRASKPFMAVNCAAIPETLFESELFGHMKGSFTGAHQNKRGLIQSADKGTLFLDEIGEMPLSLQGKLLRAIQNREVVPVGGQVPVKVDVRILAATNKDLELAVREGRFREDLYYRIHVVPLWIPPLRQRREDIPSLAQFFLKRSIEHHGKIVKGFSPEAMQALITYPWPGNVRELENMIERAVVMSPQDIITAEFLALSPQEQSKPGGLQPLTDAKEAFEKEYLQDLLKATQGNISKAAQIAGRYRADFYKLLKNMDCIPLIDRMMRLIRPANQDFNNLGTAVKMVLSHHRVWKVLDSLYLKNDK